MDGKIRKRILVMARYWEGKKGERHNRSVPIHLYDEHGVFIKEYGSIAEANRETGIGRRRIGRNFGKIIDGYIFVANRKYDSQMNYNKFTPTIEDVKEEIITAQLKLEQLISDVLKNF